MVRVRFNRSKRFPHPDGPKRAAGTEALMDAGLAAEWVERGLVSLVSPPAQDTQETPAAAPKPKGKTKARKGKGGR